MELTLTYLMRRVNLSQMLGAALLRRARGPHEQRPDLLRRYRRREERPLAEPAAGRLDRVPQRRLRHPLGDHVESQPVPQLYRHRQQRLLDQAPVNLDDVQWQVT